MNKNEWNEGLNRIDPEIVEKYVETNEKLSENKPTGRKWIRIAAIAACFAVVVGAFDSLFKPIDKIDFTTETLGPTNYPDLSDVEFTGLNFSNMQLPDEIELYRTSTCDYACDGKEVEAMAAYCKVPFENMKFRFDENTADYYEVGRADMSFIRGYRLIYQKYVPGYAQWHPVTDTKEELINKSLKIIDELPFVKNEYIDRYVQVSMGGQAIQKGDEEPCWFVKTCNFSPVINGYTVVGNGGISVGFTRSGLAKLLVNYYEYEPIGKYEIISPEEAYEQIKSPQYVVGHDRDFPVSKVTSMNIESCELVYVNSFQNGYDIIQPYYYVKGTVYSHYSDRDWEDTFTMYIPALKDKYFPIFDNIFG